mgnify:FL=1
MVSRLQGGSVPGRGNRGDAVILTLPSRSVCMNDGPTLPMLLCLHPAYKLVLALTSPVFIFERATATYLRELTDCLISSRVL